MGATQVYVKMNGINMRDAFTKAQEEAKEEHGNDYYNGQINNAPGFRDVTSEFERSKKAFDQFYKEKMELASKHEPVFAVCLKQPKTNENKIKSTVEHTVFKGTRKWILKYNVDEGWDGQHVGSKDNKGDAVKLARQHTEKTGKRTIVTMVKSLEKGESRVATVEYKKSTSESVGTYVFFGEVPE